MTKSKRRQSLSGTVLIMILVVMVILIIMLTATLTVVTTAGQRIYTKFEENQAYYTARSALDVFTTNMLDDSDYFAYANSSVKTYSYTKDDGTVDTAQMKQGLALQLDLYQIKSQNEDGVDWGLAENPYVGGGSFISGTPEEQNFAMATAAGLNYIEYDVTLPAVAKGTDNYGKIVDVDIYDEDKDGDKTDQIAKIKVEVLDRKLSMGTVYTDITTFNAASSADKQAAIVGGTRSRDYMKIKITSTVKMMDTEGVAVVIIETTEKESPSTDNALTAIGTIAGGPGAQVRAGGGVSSLNIGVTDAADGNFMSGSMFTVGSLNWESSSAGVYLNSGDSIVAMSGIVHSENSVKVTATGDNTFVFLGGTSYINNESNFGTSTQEVPVIADKIVKESASKLTFYGDAYITTFESQSNNPGKIISTGNLYIKNLILPDSCFSDPDLNGIMNVNFNHFSNANLRLCNDYTISNASGTLTYTNAGKGTIWEPYNGSSFMDTATFNSSYSDLSVEGFNIYDFDIVKKDGKLYRKYDSLPFQIDGANVVEVPTVQAYFGEYFIEGAFHETTGDLKNYSDQTNDDPSHANNEASVIYADANKNQWLYTGEDVLANYLELPKRTASDPAYTFDSVISQAGITVEPMPYTSCTIDLDSGDKYFKLENAQYSNCKWTVSGSNGRVIIICPENKTVTFNNCLLTTDQIDENTASIVNGTVDSPRTDIYGGTGSFIKTQNNCFFAAYFTLPTGKMYLNNGKTNISYDDGNGNVVAIDNTAIVGSVLCGDFEEENQSGIVYLNKDSGGAEPGEPFLSVKSVQYTRN